MTVSPAQMLERPPPNGIDILSDVLRAIRLSGAVFFQVEATAPWAAAALPGREVVHLIMPTVEHLISYHVVTAGDAWASIVDEEPVHLHAGDVVIFPHGHAHTMASSPELRGVPDLGQYRRPVDQQLPFTVHTARTGALDAQFVCGFLGCDLAPFNPLIATLPPMLILSQHDGVLRQFMDFALSESLDKRIGGECVLERVSELMFVEAVRRHVETLPPGESGWLAGLRDEFVGKALALLHARPAEAWGLDELAREVGLSRSSLAERFTELVGQPPMQYLARWRMQLAAGMLTRSSAGVAAIALRVGYDSEAAFSRAFKKLVGVPPSTWRRQKQGEAA